MTYLVTIFDARSTESNLIRPRVVAVDSLKLDVFLSKNVTSNTYCMVTLVDSDDDDERDDTSAII